MSEAVQLESIGAQVVDGYLAIPHGMKPIYLRVAGGKMVAYVQGWTAEREYDQNCFDLYALDPAKHHMLHVKAYGEGQDEEWFHDFSEPTKEAMRLHGEWDIRKKTYCP